MLNRTQFLAIPFMVLSLSTIAQAGTIPAGTEFQINTYTSLGQDVPQICSGADGNFVVVWESSADHDGQDRGIFGQRYASNGAKAGTEFQVNTYTFSDEAEPQVCCDAAGNFVVTWWNFGEDGDMFGVFGQRFASDGAFRGTEFQVNTYTTGTQADPAICCDAAGDFVIVWSSDQDGNYWGVFGQRFASDGAQRGTEFQINTFTPGFQRRPAICCDAAGDFVVAWQSEGQDGNYDGVFGQRFASGGSARGTEFQVNTYTTGGQDGPAICCDREGDFTVVWTTYIGEGPADVFGQRFVSGGAARGTEFQVNVYTTSRQREPSICCGLNGDFVVAWASEGQDGSRDGIFARRFSHTGGASSEFQVNTYTSNYQNEPAVACDANGNFVVVWESFRQDGSDEGIFGQRFQLLAQVPTPALSFAGIAVGVIALLGTAARALRRRGRGR